VPTSTVTCLFCNADAQELSPTGDARIVRCPGCLSYRLSGSAEQLLKNSPLDAQQQATASGWLREHPDTLITTEIIEKLRNMGSPIPTAKSLKLLAYIQAQTKTPGQTITLAYSDHAILSSAWLTSEPTELAWHVEQALGLQGYITYMKLSDGSGFTCVITLAGIKELQQSKRKSFGFRDGMN